MPRKIYLMSQVTGEVYAFTSFKLWDKWRKMFPDHLLCRVSEKFARGLVADEVYSFDTNGFFNPGAICQNVIY